MKKFSIYFLIIVCLFLTGCGEPKTKEVVSLDKFETILTNNNFAVSDNTNSYQGVSYITKSTKAVHGAIEIEMIDYTDIESAKKVHEGQVENFNLLKSTGAFEDRISGDNYYKYILVSNNRYMISTRVDDTLVFCKTLLENKDIVEKVYNELGY